MTQIKREEQTSSLFKIFSFLRRVVNLLERGAISNLSSESRLSLHPL
jgi:hypothetical protein